MLGSRLGTELEIELGEKLGLKLGLGFGAVLGTNVGIKLGASLWSRLGTELGEALNSVGLDVLHFCLHVAGQKNLTFFPEFGSTFLQRLFVLLADTQFAQPFLLLLL